MASEANVTMPMFQVEHFRRTFVKNFFKIFSRLGVIEAQKKVPDRQTDRQTDRRLTALYI